MEATKHHPYQGIEIKSVLKDESKVGRRQMLCRRTHGFIIKLKGETEYCFGDKKWLLSEGQVLFAEKGSSYYIREVTPGYSYVINFEAPEGFNRNMTKLPIGGNADIESYAEKLYCCWQKENVYGTLSWLYSLLEKTETCDCGYISKRDVQLLKPAVEYLQKNLTDPDLSIEKISYKTAVSDVYFRRIFKKKYGVSPSGYVMRERVRTACRLLAEDGEKSVADVACEVGYRDALYFSRVFKKCMGVNPTEYRSIHREDLF